MNNENNNNDVLMSTINEMYPDHPESKKQKVKKMIEDLTITNNVIFCSLLKEKKDLCKRFLEILLDRTDIKIGDIQYEKTIFTSPESKAIRFDILVKEIIEVEEDKDSKNQNTTKKSNTTNNNTDTKTDTNTEDTSKKNKHVTKVFDIEMQKANYSDLPLRIRYYQSAMDVETVKQGTPYKNLPESFILFICLTDPLHFGEGKYELAPRTLINHPDYIWDDKTHLLIYNCSGFDKVSDKELSSLLEFFSKGNTKTTFTKALSKAVTDIKHDQEVLKNIMTTDDLKEEGREEGIGIGKKEDVFNALEAELADDVIIAFSHISKEQLEEYKKEFYKEN